MSCDEKINEALYKYFEIWKKKNRASFTPKVEAQISSKLVEQAIERYKDQHPNVTPASNWFKKRAHNSFAYAWKKLCREYKKRKVLNLKNKTSRICLSTPEIEKADEVLNELSKYFISCKQTYPKVGVRSLMIWAFQGNYDEKLASRYKLTEKEKALCDYISQHCHKLKKLFTYNVKKLPNSQYRKFMLVTFNFKDFSQVYDIVETVDRIKKDWPVRLGQKFSYYILEESPRLLLPASIEKAARYMANYEISKAYEIFKPKNTICPTNKEVRKVIKGDDTQKYLDFIIQASTTYSD